MDKNKRYDRQLRIWGMEGQAALEQAHVCLINGGVPWSPAPAACSISRGPCEAPIWSSQGH